MIERFFQHSHREKSDPDLQVDFIQFFWFSKMVSILLSLSIIIVFYIEVKGSMSKDDRVLKRRGRRTRNQFII